MHERAHHGGIVVHAAQKHGLIAEHDAGEREPFRRRREFLRAFPRVIHVQAEPNRTAFPQNCAELGRDALRQKYGNARADAHEFHVRDRSQTREHVVDFVVGKQKKISAAHEHVAHFFVRGDVAKSGFELRMKIVAARVGNKAGTRAVAAVAGATIRRKQQHAIRVAMHEPRHGRRFFFADGIACFARRDETFFRARNDLQANRARGIFAVDQIEKMRRDREIETPLGGAKTFAFPRGERHQRFELRGSRDAVAQLPAPVVPVCGGNVRPKPLPVRPVFNFVLRKHYFFSDFFAVSRR